MKVQVTRGLSGFILLTVRSWNYISQNSLLWLGPKKNLQDLKSGCGVIIQGRSMRVPHTFTTYIYSLIWLISLPRSSSRACSFSSFSAFRGRHVQLLRSRHRFLLSSLLFSSLSAEVLKNALFCILCHVGHSERDWFQFFSQFLTCLSFISLCTQLSFPLPAMLAYTCLQTH